VERNETRQNGKIHSQIADRMKYKWIALFALMAISAITFIFFFFNIKQRIITSLSFYNAINYTFSSSIGTNYQKIVFSDSSIMCNKITNHTVEVKWIMGGKYIKKEIPSESITYHSVAGGKSGKLLMSKDDVLEFTIWCFLNWESVN
jgi:hypothetical protein